jgi:hypothetical protein
VSAAVILALGGVAGADEVHVDWARGLVIASGVGVADRHAPSPAIARGTSRRGAEDAAKKALAAAIVALPRAAGGRVGDAALPALDAVVTLDADPETDGAWRVTMAVPIEAVRQALAGGARAVTPTGDRGVPVVVVDGVTSKPAVGVAIGGAQAATLWLQTVPAWAKDAPRVHAKSSAHGAIAAPLPAEAGAATLYVILP